MSEKNSKIRNTHGPKDFVDDAYLVVGEIYYVL